jgi:hypothetical protein
MRTFFTIYIFTIVAVVSILGFRGSLFERPPIFLFPDMNWQPKYKSQGRTDFFSDGRMDRPAPANTVRRGDAQDLLMVFDPGFTTTRFTEPAAYTGRDISGEWYRGIPLPVDNELLTLGREKYDIFCLICHGAAGDGRGVTQGFGLAATSFHGPAIRNQAEGELFNTIVNGKGTMLGYGSKLTKEERWGIVLYVRALQRAANASVNDLTTEQRARLGL